MGFWSELWADLGSSVYAPQVRSATPYVADNGTVHDGPDINPPTRGEWKYNVAEGEALGLIAVFRAVQVISTSVMQLSFDAYRADELLDPKPNILNRPDPDESLSAFLEKTALSLACNGNAFWRIFRDRQGRVTVLRVLNPRDVTIQVDSFGKPIGYRVTGYEQTFTTDEIKHLSHLRVPGYPRGRGPIQAAQAELRGALDARDYGANYFQDSGVPTGTYTNKGAPLPDDKLDAAKQRILDSQGGTRGPMVLNGDWSYAPVYLSPEDAQWVSVRAFDVTAVARLFGVPASLMLAPVDGSSETYQNISQAWTEFSRFTLIKYVTEIEDALSDLLPRGTEVKANMEALLRADTSTRYQSYQLALTAGFMSVNEVRALEGLPPAPDGDFKTAEEKQAAFNAAQQAPGPGDTTQPEEAAND